ncbi:GTPase IMAP family member 8-like [Siphateles boraxobius]|uniref:GTPase IMAP family member 8-like n=1 Tax=Siphateles boraxobius TaxID=180520 RepID=UPI0040643ABF
MEEEVRAVVLGWQKSDKASVINSILGGKVESYKHFVKSVRKDGEANGRKITLINTPCWWENFGLQDSPDVVKQELVCSVFLCPPGPHVFLLVINLSLPFTEENRLSIEKHFSLFGERIWRHTIVLFTRADSLKDKYSDQRMKNEDLQQIIQRCGEKYHFFDFENKSAGVHELLIKINDVVAENNGKHFETHDDMLLDIKRKRNGNKERAEARQKMLQDKRHMLKEMEEAVAPLSKLRIVLLGWILSGKSATANTIFNNEIFQIEEAQTGTNYTGDVNGRKITVLDTPSWWKYFSSKFNPKFPQAAILQSIGQSQHMQFPHAMILVIPIDTSFKNEQRRIIAEHMASLGEDVWRHTLILFTWGDRFPDISIEQHIESEGEALQWLIEKCRNRYHVFDNTDTNRAQVTELLQKIDAMVAENGLFSLKTQCAAEESVHVSDTQHDEEISLNPDQLLKLMYQELKNRRKEMKTKLEELGMDFSGCIADDHSIEHPPNVSYNDQLKEKIRREVRRWEAIIMDGMLNVLNPEASHGEMIQSRNVMVMSWLQKCEEYSTSKTSGYEFPASFIQIFVRIKKEAEQMEEEVRAVVLGWQKSDKASVINSILGGEVASDKHFVKSVRKDGEANGRKITLINTPCWWENFGLQDSPDVVKQELVCSVFLCPPGPHVFLLVINLSLPFTEENRLSIEKHFSLFGERIWKHTIVLFTRADSLKDKYSDQRMKNEDLQQIIQRCGDKYHFFDFENKSAGVHELLIKINDVVAENNGKHFETYDDMLLERKRKRNENKERAEARQKMLQDKRHMLKEMEEAVAPLSKLRIVLLGWILSGKSATANTIFNNEIFQIKKTQMGTNYTGDVNGRKITVLDTPSWWKYFSSKFTPEFAQAAILQSIGQSQHMQFPHAMILVIPIDTSFKNEQRRIIAEHMASLGEDVWRHTLILFTWGDRFPDISIEQHIESEGEALQWLIEKCRNRYHVFNNKDTNRAQVTELLQKIDEMVAENGLFSLKTQCAAEESVHVSDTQHDEEISLNPDQLLKLMYQELKNRRKEMKTKLEELGMDFSGCIADDHSIEQPPHVSYNDQLKEKIRREVRRWEAIIMDGMLNVLNPEASHGEMIQSTNALVMSWLQKCEEYSSSKVSSKTSGYETNSEPRD